MQRFTHFFLCFVSLAWLTTTMATTSFHLANGLEVIVNEDHRAPVVISLLAYKIGSAYEPVGLTGISHALEHMMFKGTTAFPGNQFASVVNAVGGEENAFTTADYTAYYEILPSKKLPLAFKLEADRMQNLALKKSDFDKEIQVVKEERYLRTDDNPQGLTLERLMASAYLTNPYHHLTIGWKNDLDQLQIDDVRQWYHQWYGPNNAVLVVSGDITLAETKKLVNRYFAPLKAIKLSAFKTQIEPPSLGQRNVIVHTPAKLPWLVMAYDAPNLQTAHPAKDAYALEVLLAILDGSGSARLDKKLLRDHAIASSISSEYNPFSLFPSKLMIALTPSANHTVEELQQAVEQEITLLQTQPVPREELQKIKQQTIASHIFNLDSLLNRAMELARLSAVNLPWQLNDQAVNEIQKITPADVQAVAKKYLQANALTVATLVPLPLPNTATAKPSLLGGSDAILH